MNVETAFLYGSLKDSVYMKILDGYKIKNQNKVSKRNKAIYGLKQSPRLWYERLTTHLIKHEFEANKYDQALFSRNTDCKSVLFAFCR